MEPFWLEDPHILLKNGKATQFLPTVKMPFVARLNAITRFSIYLFAILFLVSDSDVWLYIPVISVMIMVLLWAINSNSEMGHSMSNNSDNIDNDDNTNNLKRSANRRQPTYENPFMNNMPSDYKNDNGHLEERLSMPAEEFTNVKDDVDKQYYSNMYRNSSDLYEQESSKRSFYSMPSTTVPNDQDAFANWCYRAPTVCKETGEGCLRYADPQNQRRVSREEYVI